MFKKFYILTVFLAVFSLSATVLFAQEENAVDDDANVSLPGFQLLFSGEIGYADNSDMSDFSKARGNFLVGEYNAAAASAIPPGPQDFKSTETTNPNTNYGFDLEFRFFPGSWGLGIGTGIHIAESIVEIKSESGYWTNEIEYTTSLAVIPVVATFYYLKPVNSWSFFTFGAGVGKYFAFLDGVASSNDTALDYINVYEPMSDIESTFGFNLKAEYTLYFRPFCLTAGIMGRYVQFDKFKDDVEIKMDAGLTGVSLYLAAGLAI